MTAVPVAAGRQMVVVSEPDPDAIAAAVRACPSVAGLDGGRFGEAVTYLPGRRVTGVAISDQLVTVSVVGTKDATASRLLTEIREALTGQLLGRKILVAFADIELALPRA